MKLSKAFSFSMIGLLVAAATSHGAAIAWTTGGITGDTNVSTDGTLVEAANFGGVGVPSPVINTVIFTGVNFGGGDSLTNLNGLSYNNSQNSHNPSIGGGIDILLDTIAFESGTGSQITDLSGLIIGNVYQVQFFVNHPPTSGRTQTIGDGLGNNAVIDNVPPSFATGTFTADDSIQTLTFSSSVGSQLMNGYQLRNLGPVPEPSTALLSLFGLATIFLRRVKTA